MTKRQTKKAAEPEVKVPDRLFGIASPRSVGGVSLFDAQQQIYSETVPNFYSEEKVIYGAVDKLRLAGFEILQVTRTTINIAGSVDTYNAAFGAKIYHEERPVIKEGAVEDTATFWDSPTADLPGLVSTKGTPFDDVLEGVAIESPVYFMESMFPPTKEYWHLDVPADVSLGCNADKAHRAGTTGKDIKVAMVDSGHYLHPFFVGRGYRVAPVVLGPAAANPLHDESGHGTGESANIFSVAPDVQLLPVKINFVNSLGAFNAAVGLEPHIITCSWGRSIQFGPLDAPAQALAAAIATAVSRGIVVVFSAGNGHWGFPGQHPDVISAGGVFMDQDGSLQASNYSSGFMSNVYANRRCPDLSGLVGMQPGASYIMLPVEPGDNIDTTRAGGTHPPDDETASDDGWAAFSGTSAAAPQLAGAAALVKQVCPRLTPAQVRDILMKSARDVTVGNCHPATGGNPAVAGPDTATGNGLVDAHKATLVARIRCLGAITRPTVSRGPGITTPVPPPTPAPTPAPTPRIPVRADPAPAPPTIADPPPIGTIGGITRPTEGEEPAVTDMEQQMPGLSAEEVQALEDLILGSDLDIDDLNP